MNKTRHGDSLTSPMSMDAELTVGFLSLKESYVSRVTCTPYLSVEVSCSLVILECRPRAHIPLQAVALSSTPLFKTLSTTWRFQASPHTTGYLPHQDSWSNSETQAVPVGVHRAGSTLVTLDLTFAFSNPVHATVSATFFGQVSKLMVKAFEERCVEVYGPGNK
jgi:coenzyme Q-binding protein COQ10